MFQKIKVAVERIRANADHKLHLAGALEAIGAEITTIKERLAGLGHEATGETGAKVDELSARLSSLTSAVTALGDTVNGSVLSTYSTLAARVATLEAKATAPAVPVPPQA